MLQVWMSLWPWCRCLAFAVISLALLKVSNAQGCTVNQYKKTFNASGASICVDCPRCPIGYGLVPQCGTNIPANSRIRCQQCTRGANYSMNYDHEQCLPCGRCSDDQVMAQCTPESKTICHSRCKSKGNYFERSSGDCQKCSWCCGDGQDVVEEECLKKGMPRKQSCTIHRKKKCTPLVPLVTTKTDFSSTYSPKLKPTTYSISTIHIVSTSINTPSSPTSKTPNGPNDSKNKKKDDKTEINIYLVIMITIACVLILIAIVILVKKCCYNPRRKHRCYRCYICNPTFPCTCHPLHPRRHQQDPQTPAPVGLHQPSIVHIKEHPSQTQPLLDQQPHPQTPPPVGLDQPSVVRIEEPHLQSPIVGLDPANHVIIGADIRLFDWFKKGNNWQVKDKICTKLDTDGSFAKVACHFQMDDDEIKKIKQRSSNPAEDVLEKLSTSKPGLLVSEFVKCTNSINRKDVSELLERALVDNIGITTQA